jgi:para-aminobenzoate synthetase/4-amino-4-deoxychorismate lyase
MPTDRLVPLIWFALYPRLVSMKERELAAFVEGRSAGAETGGLNEIRPNQTMAGYLRHFERVKELIASGDIYQANLAFRLLFKYEGAPFSLYASLRDRQPVSYGAFLECADFSILSFSPELFFEVQKGQIFTKPMKGTIRRGVTMEEDLELSRQLHLDPKNRAENLMIVDLMRNDFARICEVGSVEVTDPYRVAPFPSLYQMTSEVRGRMRADVGLAELVQALIPAGSITGAPKIRAQKVIRELEEGPRGLYCGAMGMISRDQQSGQLSALFNVAIRTLTLFPDGHGETGIGSGIVQDSQGEDEYAECLLKASFLTMPDFKLIETMRLDGDGRFYLLERHLARLERSGRKFGFLCPLEDIRQELQQLAKTRGVGCFRVRLLLSTGGRFELTSIPVDPPDPCKTIAFIISDKRVDSADDLLAHKTTRRQFFDGEWAKANREQGADEVLFLNEREELTEGARSNLFIERDGKLLTPPLVCGLLPGTLREQLLAEGRLVEVVLGVDDLQNTSIFFGNSVRGLQPARLVGEK